MSRTKQTQPSSQRDGPRCRRTSRWERTRRREEVGKTIIMKEEKKDGVDLSFPASEVNRIIVDGHIWGQPWREGSAKKRTRN